MEGRRERERWEIQRLMMDIEHREGCIKGSGIN